MVDRRLILQATLASLLPVANARPAFAWGASAEPVDFDGLYERQTVFSEKAKGLDGKLVEMKGFMAPPLKAESLFFVLTRMPMSVCPFCETEADWPSDIVVVYTDTPVSVVPFNYPIRVSGTLQLGTTKDPEMGFVSRVRIRDAGFERV